MQRSTLASLSVSQPLKLGNATGEQQTQSVHIIALIININAQIKCLTLGFYRNCRRVKKHH